MNDLLAGLAGAGCVFGLVLFALPFVLRETGPHVEALWEFWKEFTQWAGESWIGAWRDVIARWRGPQ